MAIQDVYVTATQYDVEGLNYDYVTIGGRRYAESTGPQVSPAALLCANSGTKATLARLVSSTYC